MVQTHDDSSAITDTVTFRIASGNHLRSPWAKVLVLVDVIERADPPDDRDALFERVNDRLREFIDATWSVEGFHRGLDSAGMSRARVVASARLDYDAMQGLDERATRASTNGFAIRRPILVPVVCRQWASHASQTLEEQMLEQIAVRARRLSRTTRRKWRIGDVRFVYSWSSARMALEPTGKARSGGGSERCSPWVETECLWLTAHVVLKSNAPGFRPPRLPDPPVTAAHEEWERVHALLRDVVYPARPPRAAGR